MKINNQPRLYSKHQAGVTLIELIIYMGLFMGFFILLSGLFVSILDVQRDTSETAKIEQDSQFLFSRLQYDIGRATTISIPEAPGATSSALVLTTPEGEISYALENEQLKLSLNGSPSASLTSSEVKVTQASFQNLSNENGLPSIRTALTIQSALLDSSQPEIRNLIYTFGTR